jgi:hypothetical protein
MKISRKQEQHLWIGCNHRGDDCGFGSILSARSQAQSTPFYKDKTIRMIVGFSAGSLSDQYAGILARHMGKPIPGHPNIIVENMPGSGTYLDQILGRKEVIDRVKKFSE